ncbi:helix-turn-helix transcriptional regulator [Pelagovum sp. HNIBRBA483]
MSVPHIRHMSREGRFPKPIQISANRFAWSEQDVEDWIDACIERHKHP